MLVRCGGLATAIGLVAAIPAVIIYNFFARWSAAYRTGLGDAAAGVERGPAWMLEPLTVLTAMARATERVGEPHPQTGRPAEEAETLTRG